MYFLIVTDDIWGKKSFSTQEYDCDPDDPDCGAAEKATPFNQIVFQSNRNGETNIYSVELDFEDRLSKISIETQMTDEFLMMTDRFSMAHSLEARTPYLDHEFVELVFSMPSEIKMDYGHNKYKSTAPDIGDHGPNKSYYNKSSCNSRIYFILRKVN